MKLLLIGPYPVRNNGISNYMAELRGEWIRQGHQVDTEIMYFWRSKLSNGRWLSLRRRLLDGFDGVLVQHTPTASGPLLPIFLRAAKQAKVPVLIESHETPATYAKHLPQWLRPLYYGYEKAVCHGAATTLVHTRFHRDALLALKISVPIEVIPLPIYGDAQSPIESPLRDSWGYYGMISAKKGLDLLLKTYQAAQPGHYPPLRILGEAAPGNEAYVHGLRAEVKPEYRDLITFVGYVDEAKLAHEFSRISAMIFPYRWVSQSAALAQTCFYRIPYLASDIPFFQEFHASYGCGRLFTSESLASLAEALEALRRQPLQAHALPFDRLTDELSLRHCVERQTALFACYAKAHHA
jgi:glycosyltransferase involved in cell wall biosynthesis